MASAPPPSTKRRDKLVENEAKAQAKWDAGKVFEVDAPAGKWDGGKFMVTFPYPYMNGKLHLGHAFSLSKAEFAVAYQRMQGKKALFPFAFHCTGMPIQAAAFKLQKEYANYGSPLPNFPPSPPEVVQMDAEAGAITIGWKAPTSTGGHTLTAFQILVREGPAGSAEYAERKTLDAKDMKPGEQCSITIDGLTVGQNYSFVVVSQLAGGAAGVRSKALEKSADGKHPLALLAPKADDKKGKDKGGGGGPKKPAKVVAKTGGLTTQWDILRSMGLTVEDCVAFVDPVHWLRFFPPLGKRDLIKFGVGVDWRRSFITTDYNPYYDTFVRWQFQKLKAHGDFIAFGKRPSIFSEADNQPCMDHDRDKGEGVAPQEYTALKIQVLEPLPEVLKPLQGKTIFCLAATLRPETMCGQTNVWILPEGEYGAFDAGKGQVYICAARAARNMSFQGIFPEWAKTECLLKLKGASLLGAKVRAPSTKYSEIYMLPLTTISMTKGTAIVTSVPSDSPDDYAAFMDLKNPKKRDFYGVKAEWVEPFELIPIIRAEIDGEEREMCAEYMCQKLKVQSQKDVDKLHEAHDVVYTAGFYKGVMTCGPFAGQSVQDAKVKCKKAMCDAGEAFTYLEPEGLVTPRSTPDVECVVALVDQWYLKYGEESWAKAVGMHLDKMEMFNPSVSKAFKDALGWLSDWACSRSFGLGTRMPWDEQFLIESLSDSTIYMAYYLVAHFLQGGDLNGRDTGPSGVQPAQCTEQFWDMVMLGKPYDKSVGVPEATIAAMRKEVAFWYPMDLRVSGKDLIPNHLTMSLYNHAAVWKDDPSMWPLGIFCNGHVQVDAEKMSKSKGNFVTMEGAIELWGADATRFTCADAGDGVLNANYDRVVADRAILGLTTELDWVEDILSGKATKGQGGSAPALRAKGAPSVWLDRWFANEMGRLVRECAEKYESMRFKEALKVGYYLMQEARDRYRTGTAHVGCDEGLVRQWAEWQALLMTPITPHWSEALWVLLGKPGCIVQAAWPKPSAPEDTQITAAGNYLFDVTHSLAAALANRGKKKPAKGAPPADTEKPNQVNLYVATRFPRWKEIVIDLLREHFDAATSTVAPEVMQLLNKHEELKSFNKGKQVAQFAAMVRSEAESKGAAALALSMPFDELAVLGDNLPYLCATLNVAKVHLYTDSAEGPQPEVQQQAVPGKPQPHFYFSDDLSGPPPPAAGSAGTAASAAAPKKPSCFDYLEAHDVAAILNKAVNELGNAQPADPYKWLSEHLAQIAKEKAKK